MIDYKKYTEEQEKESIEKLLINMEGFHDLLKVRRFFHKHEEKIRSFYILNGKYHIDQFGQIGKVEGMDELKKYFDIPLIMSDSEFYEIFRQYEIKMNTITLKETKDLSWVEIRKLHELGRPYPIYVSTSINSFLPNTNTVCDYCKKTWELSNIDDCLHHQSEWKSYSIKDLTKLHCFGLRPNQTDLFDFVGQPIQNFWDYIESKNNAVYHHYIDNGVTNSKLVDMSSDPNHETINANGFYLGKIDKNYILQEGDKVNFQSTKFYHKECNREFLNQNDLKKFKNCFTKAGFEDFVLISIPNEYCHDIKNCTICSSWFNVETKWGVIKIGWRKRVINIDWSHIEKVNGNEIFKDQETTTGEYMVHAWGYEKCIEYLEKLKESFIIKS